MENFTCKRTDGKEVLFEKDSMSNKEYTISSIVNNKKRELYLTESDIINLHDNMKRGVGFFTDNSDKYEFNIARDSDIYTISIYDDIHGDTFSLNIKTEEYNKLVDAFKKIKGDIDMPLQAGDTIYIADAGQRSGYASNTAKWVGFNEPREMYVAKYNSIGSDKHGHENVLITFNGVDNLEDSVTLQYMKSEIGWIRSESPFSSTIVADKDYDTVNQEVKAKLIRSAKDNIELHDVYVSICEKLDVIDENLSKNINDISY